MTDLLQPVTAMNMAKWAGDAVHGHAAALKQRWLLTWREAQTQTFASAFLVIAACFVVANLMVPCRWCARSYYPQRRQRRRIDVSIASPERSPRHRHSFIERHHIGARRPVSDNSSITRQKAETLGTRLGNQHPVKRIAMPLRQCDQ